MTWALSADGRVLCGSCQRVLRMSDGDMVEHCQECFPEARPIRPDHLAIVFGARRAANGGGPGTELKSMLLRFFGIGTASGCPCVAHAAQMDLWGPDECERRADEIVGWLRAEAEKRRLPFVSAAAKHLVLLAARRARKAAAGGRSGDINP